MRDILAAAAYPTVKTAAKAIVQALTRARERLRDREANGKGGAEVDYFDVVTRDCLAEARRILSVVDEIDEIAS
jgi:hypothetical protein